MTVLTCSSGLLLVLVLGQCLRRDGFAIGHAWKTDIDIHAKAASHPIESDLNVWLAKTRENRLSSYRIAIDVKRWIFLGETSKRLAHFVEVGLGFRTHCGSVGRSWELNVRENEVLLLSRHRVRVRRDREFSDCGDVTSGYRVGRNVLATAHEEKLSTPLSLALGCVEDRRI